MQRTSPAHLAHRGWWEVQSCVSVTFPGKDKACLICLARTNLCPREVLDIFLCGATPFLLLSNYDWQGFPQALCWVRVELCLEIVRTSRPGTFFFFSKSSSVPSCDTAVYKRAACQALHMCICYSSTCHVAKQPIQSWYYSISWRNAKLGGSVDRKALCSLIFI